MNKTRRPGGLCVLVLMALVLVAVPGVPATADHAPPPTPVESGTGNLQGTESVQDEAFLGIACFRVTRSVFALRGAGTYHGQSASGGEVVYRAAINEGETLHQHGPLQIEVENTEPYYHGPYGTHGTTGATCDPPTAGTPVPAEFRIFAADHVYRLDDAGAQVPCTGQGNFARGHLDGEVNWRAEWTLGEDCVVVGNEAGTPGSGTAPAGTAHTHHGKHAGCFNPPCYENFNVDYVQYLPIDGPYLGLSGPASAATEENVTVTARLTDDGNAVANAPITFSVTGPAAAVPPVGAATTGADGRATFTFTATVVGDYTVAASATHDGQVLSATHTVSFTPPAPLTVSLAGPTFAQTDESVTINATVTDAGDPVPAATVDFAVSVESVAGPGQATPASGSATTDLNGQASFSFSGDRAGNYTVTATATHLGEQASATHTVHLDINTFYRVGGLDFPEGEDTHRAAVIDPAGRFAYFAVRGGKVVKVDLATFERVGALTLNSGENNFTSAVIDPAGRYAYFGTGNTPGRVVKIDLDTFQRVGAITLNTGESVLESAVMDPAGSYAYFGTAATGAMGRVVKIDLGSFQRVGAITFEAGEAQLFSAVVAPAGDYVYFGTKSEGQGADRVVKVDLATFRRVGAITLDSAEEQFLHTAVIDPAGDYAYFTTSTSGRVIKIDLNAFRRVGHITVEPHYEDRLASAVIDPDGNFAYFGTDLYFSNVPDRIIKVDLRTFERAHAINVDLEEKGLTSAVIDPAGDFAYFGTRDPGTDLRPSPANVVKVALTRPPKAALVAGDDAYATDYLTPLTVPAPGVLANDVDTEDGDPLTAHHASDPAGGSVELNPDGSFTYTPDVGFGGTDTFTYTASDGMDYSAPATVSIAVGAAPEGVQAVSGDALGYYSDVSLFDGDFETRGPDPTVTLPATGSAAPVTASAPSGSAVYGPAVIFESGPLEVSTSGAIGPGGSSTASASAAQVGPGPLTADSMASTCTSTEGASGGSTTLSGAQVVVSQGEDWDSEADDVVVAIPDDPAPNTEVHGALESVGDRFRVVFNEQIPGPDAITVNAAHMYLEGPTAVGELIVGQSRCGVVTDAPNAAPVATDDAYTTPTDTPLSVSPPGVLANDSDPEGQALSAAKLIPAFPASPEAGWVFPSDPANGSLVLNDDDGSFTYTPNEGFTGTDTFPYRVADPRGASDEGMVTITVDDSTPPGVDPAPVADFDGDGDTDRSVYRPSNGMWFARGIVDVAWGTGEDVPVPADYDGDGDTDVAVFRPSTGEWFVQGQSVVRWGTSGDIPVPGDYDNDGAAEVAVFRPSTGEWFVQGQPVLRWGVGTDVPVPGDYDNDGVAEVAVFRPSTGEWFVQGQSVVRWGTSGDVPVPGDYDNDGAAEIAVFRPSTGHWFVEGQPVVSWGTSGDIPVPGDYDADGDTDVAVFRPGTGQWFVPGSPVERWGTSGDVPLPLPYAIRSAYFPAQPAT